MDRTLNNGPEMFPIARVSFLGPPNNPFRSSMFQAVRAVLRKMGMAIGMIIAFEKIESNLNHIHRRR